jgi:hypothetical protein
MIIDTDEKTVVFPGYTKLTVDQLWALIDVLDPFEMEHGDEDGRVKQSDICHIYEMPSQSRRGTYALVQFADDSWACSCPDWIHRKSKSPYNDPCKHIFRQYYILLTN